MIPARVLLAEDDPSNRKVTQLMLNRLGYEADAVANGLEVLQALRFKDYDLILMDIIMPKMDGLETAKEIRICQPEFDQPVIIAFTAYCLPDISNGRFLTNMDGYLYKPVRREDLRTAVEASLRVLNRRRRSVDRLTCKDVLLYL